MTFRVLIVNINLYVLTGKLELVYLCNISAEMLKVEKNCIEAKNQIFQSATVLRVPADVEADIMEGDSVYVEEVIA